MSRVDWSLLEKDPNRFYEQYDVKAIWVINLADKKRVGSVGDTGGYVRPGSHQTLSIAWGPIENGRRFALAAYQWKWGTDTLLLLDVGRDDCHSAQIGPVLDKAIEAQIKRGKSQKARTVRFYLSPYWPAGTWKDNWLFQCYHSWSSIRHKESRTGLLLSAKAFSHSSSHAPAKAPLPVSLGLLPDRCRTIRSPNQHDLLRPTAN